MTWLSGAVSPKAYTYLCGAFAALGSTLFGYDLGIIASVISAPNFLEVTGNPNPGYQGFIVSSLQLGGFVGCVPASLVADRFSRRTAITLGATTFLLGGALQTGAQSKEMMLAGRFFAGLAIGQLSLLAPLYQGEIAHPSIRGSMLSYQQFFLGWGGLIATWIGFACSQSKLHGTQAQWRMPLGLQILPAVPLVFLTFLLPESPRWLLIRGREEESLATLARLHARGDINDPFVQGEFAEMRMKLRQEAEMQTSWTQMLSDRSNLRKLMLGITLQFSVQFTGVSVLQYYAARVYDAIGFSTTKALLIQACNNIGAQIAETLCVIFADRMGRRWPLIICNVFSGITFAVGTANQKSFSDGHGTRGIGYCFVAMTYIFNFFFSLAIGPLSWAYPVEIFNTGIRAKAIMITSMASWIANFMFGQMAPTVFTQIGWRFYIVFAVCSFTNAIVVWLFFPETKGRTLEEMDIYFREMPLIVAFAKTEVVDRSRRERELREVGQHREDRVPDGGEKAGQFEANELPGKKAADMV